MHFSEFLVVIIIAIVVFPPKKLPELAQMLGRFIRYAKAIKNDILCSFHSVEQHIQLQENKKRAEEVGKNNPLSPYDNEMR